MISAIILAAGLSSRLGRPKQLLPLGDSTVIERVVHSLEQANVVEVVVVLGHRAEEIIAHLPKSGFIRTAVNPDYNEGMASSIRCGLRHAARHVDGYLIALGDKPLIDTPLINLVIEAFYMYGRGIVVPTFRGVRGHPVIVPASMRDELKSLTGDTGAKEIIARSGGQVYELPVDTDAVLADVDTMDDYRQLLERLESEEGG